MLTITGEFVKDVFSLAVTDPDSAACSRGAEMQGVQGPDSEKHFPIPSGPDPLNAALVACLALTVPGTVFLFPHCPTLPNRDSV